MDRKHQEAREPCEVCEHQEDPCLVNSCFRTHSRMCGYDCEKIVKYRRNMRRLQDAKFCPECGRRLVHAAPTVEPQADTRYREAVERLGEFGRLFVAYKGDPRGPAGRPGGLSLKDEGLSMPVLEDVDGGRWRPVNEDALRELLARMDELVADYIGED